MVLSNHVSYGREEADGARGNRISTRSCMGAEGARGQCIKCMCICVCAFVYVHLYMCICSLNVAVDIRECVGEWFGLLSPN